MQTKFTLQRSVSREMWAECVCDKCCHEEEKQKEFAVSEFHESSKNLLTPVLFSSPFYAQENLMFLKEIILER